jgi:acetyl-CoA carboxylase biotin carboxyl carrier protein
MADEKQAERAASGAAQTKVDIEGVRQLLALMKENDLAELEVEQGDMAVRLRKAGVPAAAAVLPAPVAAVAAASASGVRDEKLPTINSPIVGTFYAAPSPEAAPCIKVGDHVVEDTVVCVIEAMKVFNEIRAEMSGTIERIVVKNAQAVEFGQALFVVRPD